MGLRLRLEAATATHIGRRANNEDCAGCSAELGLYVVADGMGGYEGGEVASRLAVESITAFLERNVRDPGGTWPLRADRTRTFEENLLAAAVERAHLDVCEQRTGAVRDMGSTVVAMLVHGAAVTLAHVGDSRAYRLRAGTLERLTRDHSMQEEMKAQGVDFPFRNYITRALGVDAHAPELSALELAPGETFLLCTDGLYEALPEEEIARALASEDTQGAADALVTRAVECGAHDNVTVVVVRVSPLPLGRGPG